MPSWIAAALGALLFFAAHYVTLRAASGRIGDAWGGLVVEVAAAVGLLALAVLGPAAEVPTTRAGLLWSGVSGLCITGGVFLLFQSLRLGGPVAGTGTIALGGGVALASLVSPFVYGEALTPRRLIGVALGLAAVAVLATERGPEVAGGAG